MNTTGDIEGNFQGELDCFLRACGHDDCWRVLEVLKEDDETGSTEIVAPVGFSTSNGACMGTPQRFVRKIYPGQSDGADVYEVLQRAQQSGLLIGCVPRIIECLRGPECRSVVMEYVEGPTLAEYIMRSNVLPATIKYLFLQLCVAVRELHERIDPPVIHRDLKPSNIIVSPKGPVLIDFGIARLWHEGAECDTTHFGTRRYAPPEQFGFGQTDVRSDIYALGKVLFFCLTGKQPPNALDARSCEEYGVPRPFARVICKACAFDPRERYASVRELGAAVGSLPSHAWEECSGMLPSNLASQCDSLVTRVNRTCTSMRNGANAFLHLLRRTPRWVGAIWNLLLLCNLILCIMGSQFAIFRPNAYDSALPFWFRIMEYDLLTVVAPAAIVSILLDKRGMWKRVPVLRNCGQLQVCLVGTGVIVMCFTVTVCASLVALPKL